MNKNFKALFVGVGIAVAAASHALTFNLTNVWTQGNGGLVSGFNFVTIKLTDNGANKVKLEVTNNLTTHPNSFISKIYLNLRPVAVSTPITTSVLTAGTPSNYIQGTSQGNNTVNGAGGTDWDFEIDLRTSATAQAFTNPTKTVSFNLTGTGLDETDFNALSPQSYFAGVHMQGLNNGASAHIAAVPEPASLAILGLGAAALLRRRRK